MNRASFRTGLVPFIFGAVFLALVVGCYQQESATMDEAQHLTAGYAALKQADYRMGIEHLPFVRMWAALPLLMVPEVKFATNSPYWLTGNEYPFAHQFLFQDNDADRLLFRTRFMIALLGVLLGLLVFCWARELFGFWPATIVLGLYCTEPNLVAHSGLVTTDLGATCFIFGAVYFAWRISREFSPGNLVGLTLFFVLAYISKYSALLLGPLLFALLLLRALHAEPWLGHIGRPKLLTPRRTKALLTALMIGALLALSYAAIWGVYAFRYAPTPAGLEQVQFVPDDEAQRRLPQLTRFMQWIDEHRLLPNACAQGFALAATRMSGRQAYLWGQTSSEGWWYYFPVAILIKTPMALLLMASAGLMLCAASRTTTGRDALFVVGPLAAYLGTAMTSQLNIGLRHVLTVYPFLLLLAGWTITALSPWPGSGVWRRWRSFVLAALCLTQLAEFAVVYPHCLAFFNVSVGGARHGAEYLVDSNLDWGQGLKLLRRWMTEHHVRHVNLSYFGTADPTYYGIVYTPLPSQPVFYAGPISAIRLPGYVAISATNLRSAYLNDGERNLYAPLRKREPIAVLGYSIYVYWVEKPWW